MPYKEYFCGEHENIFINYCPKESKEFIEFYKSANSEFRTCSFFKIAYIFQSSFIYLELPFEIKLLGINKMAVLFT